MAATFPGGIVSFATRNPNGVIASAHMNGVQEEITALETAPLTSTSWTPTIGGSGGQSGQVYAGQEGTYSKIGLWTLFHCRVTLSTLGTITGTVKIKGLPAVSGGSVPQSVTVGYWTGLTTALVSMTGVVDAGASTISVFGLTAAGTAQATLAQADLGASTQIVVSGLYLAAS